jgi:hypothetical protein
MHKSRRGSYAKSAKKGYVDAKQRWQDAHHTTSKVAIPAPVADAIDNLTSLLNTYMKGRYCYSIMLLSDTYTGDIIAAVNPSLGTVEPNRGKGKS